MTEFPRRKAKIARKKEKALYNLQTRNALSRGTAQKRKGNAHGVRKTARTTPLLRFPDRYARTNSTREGRKQKQQRMARGYIIF